MKKTYMTPEMLAVTLQHQTSILDLSIQHVIESGDTGLEGPYKDDPTTGGADVKGFTSQDLWNNEW